MDTLKSALRASIETLASEAKNRFASEEARDLSQAALNLSATLAQLVNIDFQEAHMAEDRAAEAGGGLMN